jgi:hypothetical protein
MGIISKRGKNNMKLQKGKTYTGDELEQLGYDINPDETQPFDRTYITTCFDDDGNVKYQYEISDVGNDCYYVVRSKYK